MKVTHGWWTSYHAMKFAEKYFWHIHPKGTSPKNISVQQNGHDRYDVTIVFDVPKSNIYDESESYSVISWVLNRSNRNRRIYGIGHKDPAGKYQIVHFDEIGDQWIEGVPENRF